MKIKLLFFGQLHDKNMLFHVEKIYFATKKSDFTTFLFTFPTKYVKYRFSAYEPLVVYGANL
jgi:hypothetical protein